MCGKLPVVVILGATGAGKTKLSLELAKKFSGEIIGADSMQVYKGLDIITAKVSKEDRLIAPHHLVDFLEPHNSFTVLEYRNQALNVINDLISQNKLPIVVGGTNYYIESILWDILVDKESDNLKVMPWESLNKNHELSSRELHGKLKLLDPDMAKRLHPNNKRKILRSLEILHQKGKRHSEILEEQHSSHGGSKTSGALRYPNSIILWMKCEKKQLELRLNDRVDEMMKQGLVDELLDFHKQFKHPDYTRGIFQSIGFKEFRAYLTMEENDRNSHEGVKTLQECIELLKVTTRQYANKQLRWVTNRFLGRTDREVPPVYSLDTTNINEYNDNVISRASVIVESYISGKECPYEKLPKLVTKSYSNADDETFFCDVCDRVFVGNFQWKSHLKSNKHKRRRTKKLQQDISVSENS